MCFFLTICRRKSHNSPSSVAAAKDSRLFMESVWINTILCHGTKAEKIDFVGTLFRHLLNEKIGESRFANIIKKIVKMDSGQCYASFTEIISDISAIPENLNSPFCPPPLDKKSFARCKAPFLCYLRHHPTVASQSWRISVRSAGRRWRACCFRFSGTP